MKTTILVAVLFCSFAARAGTEPDWSVGAGASYGFESVLGSSGDIGYSGPSASASTVTPTASLERRVGDGTWLLLGVTGNFSRSTAVLPANLSAYNTFDTSSTGGGGSLALGVRHYLTDPGALIGVSIHGGIEAGVQANSTDYTTVDANGVATSGTASATAYSVGAFGGFALDKSLTDRLSLRLSVALISIDYTKVTTSPSSVQGASSSFGAALGFDPDLELRLAF